MNILSYSKIHNALLYQAIWFTAVQGTQQYEWVLVLLLLLHVFWSGQGQKEVTVMVVGAALGVSMDALFTSAGAYVFSSSPSWIPIPFWLLAIWMGFCATLRHSLHVLVNKPMLITILAAVGAPMSYLAAQRFGAVEFPLGNVYTAVMIGVGWTLIMPLLVLLAREKRERQCPSVSF